MKSLLGGLSKRSLQLPFSLNESFQTHPGSLKEIVDILHLPVPQLDTLKRRKILEFEENNSQGLTFAQEDIWYLASEKRITIYRFRGADLYHPKKERINHANLSDLVERAGLNGHDYDHIGDLAFHRGLVFAPLRRRGEKPPHLLLALSVNLDVVGYSHLPMNTRDDWCAINPWNECLYIPDVRLDNHVNAFDLTSYYQLLETPDLWGNETELPLLERKQFMFHKQDGSPDPTGGVQGITFSKNGRLYVARYTTHSMVLYDYWKSYIYVYDAMSGIRLDSSSEIDFPEAFDEIEGLSMHPSGVLYAAVAIHDQATRDEFEVWAFKYADPLFPA